MEYKESSKLLKRMEAARKFIRISSTMLRDIDNELLENGVLCTGVNWVELASAADFLDSYINKFSRQHVPDGGQLSLFSD